MKATVKAQLTGMEVTEVEEEAGVYTQGQTDMLLSEHEHPLLSQRTQAWFPHPHQVAYKPVTPVPGDPISSQASSGTTCMYTAFSNLHIQITKNKIKKKVLCLFKF